MSPMAGHGADLTNLPHGEKFRGLNGQVAGTRTLGQYKEGDGASLNIYPQNIYEEITDGNYGKSYIDDQRLPVPGNTGGVQGRQNDVPSQILKGPEKIHYLPELLDVGLLEYLQERDLLNQQNTNNNAYGNGQREEDPKRIPQLQDVDLLENQNIHQNTDTQMNAKSYTDYIIRKIIQNSKLRGRFLDKERLNFPPLSAESDDSASKLIKNPHGGRFQEFWDYDFVPSENITRRDPVLLGKMIDAF